MSNCAIGPDGSLKDASEIEWFNDADDEQPISVPVAKVSNPLHLFFTGTAAPSVFVAGARRSARVPRPSMRILDPDNVAISKSSTAQGKQKAADDPCAHR